MPTKKLTGLQRPKAGQMIVRCRVGDALDSMKKQSAMIWR